MAAKQVRPDGSTSNQRSRLTVGYLQAYNVFLFIYFQIISHRTGDDAFVFFLR